MPFQGFDEFKPFVFAIYLLNVKIDLQSYHSIKVSLALRNIQGGKYHFINIVNEIGRSFKNVSLKHRRAERLAFKNTLLLMKFSLKEYL